MEKKPGTTSNSNETLTQVPALKYLTCTCTAKCVNTSLSELIRNRLYFPFRVIKRNEGNVLSHKAHGARKKPDEDKMRGK